MLWGGGWTENTQNNVIEEEIRRDMTVETDQKFQQTVEAYANIPFQLKQRDDILAIAIIICNINKGNDDMNIP